MLTLHTSSKYAVYLHDNAGIIVEYKGSIKQGGTRLPPSHPQFNEYLEAFNTAIDGSEADALCKALRS